MKKYSLAIEQHPNGSVSSFHVEPPKNVEMVDFVQSKWNIVPEFKITDEIPMEHVKNILIATTWRSGSSFFGNILNQYPGTFYSYEPLHYLSNFVSNSKNSGANWDNLNSICVYLTLFSGYVEKLFHTS